MRSNISLEEALEILLQQNFKTEAIQVSLLDSLDSVLAEDIISDMNMPPFDRSPLDGYALRSVDLIDVSKENPITLDVIDYIPAGYVSKKALLQGQAMRIMTGAKIPEGADAIIRFEDTEFTDTSVNIYDPVLAGANISKEGEDIKIADVVLHKGCILDAPEIGILATLGRGFVQVFRKPRVAILSTGDELVEIQHSLVEGKIRNSNSYTIAALVKKAGAKPLLLGICPDEVNIIREKLVTTLSWADLVITTGGVSVGDSDLVKEAFKQAGAEMLFWKVRMKPGTPIAVAKYRNKLIFGLSGNPAAAYITFEQFVRPVILKMMGREKFNLMKVEAILESDFKKISGQNRFVRAHTYYKEGSYYTSFPEKHSSGILSSLSGTNSLLYIHKGTGPYLAGQQVRVQLLDQPEVL